MLETTTAGAARVAFVEEATVVEAGLDFGMLMNITIIHNFQILMLPLLLPLPLCAHPRSSPIVATPRPSKLKGIASKPRAIDEVGIELMRATDSGWLTYYILWPLALLIQFLCGTSGLIFKPLLFCSVILTLCCAVTASFLDVEDD